MKKDVNSICMAQGKGLRLERLDMKGILSSDKAVMSPTLQSPGRTHHGSNSGYCRLHIVDVPMKTRDVYLHYSGYCYQSVTHFKGQKKEVIID
ncbi:hypothetical protein [Arcticibacter sp.]|jgi:hypothetical protein|uniref:hypothetical protein n=1 Tax=Arcticibacter sp. TaxID=1872630 RepID=UPI0038903A3E